ncbi:MAG: hypothetical protein HY390_02340 [Deltaproteobacteria bacterium]|nr:hypothetical protein [Deltaproteobacteria bacterium]
MLKTLIFKITFIFLCTPVFSQGKEVFVQTIGSAVQDYLAGKIQPQVFFSDLDQIFLTFNPQHSSEIDKTLRLMAFEAQQMMFSNYLAPLVMNYLAQRSMADKEKKILEGLGIRDVDPWMVVVSSPLKAHFDYLVAKGAQYTDRTDWNIANLKLTLKDLKEDSFLNESLSKFFSESVASNLLDSNRSISIIIGNYVILPPQDVSNTTPLSIIGFEEFKERIEQWKKIFEQEVKRYLEASQKALSYDGLMQGYETAADFDKQDAFKTILIARRELKSLGIPLQSQSNIDSVIAKLQEFDRTILEQGVQDLYWAAASPVLAAASVIFMWASPFIAGFITSRAVATTALHTTTASVIAARSGIQFASTMAFTTKALIVFPLAASYGLSALNASIDHVYQHKTWLAGFFEELRNSGPQTLALTALFSLLPSGAALSGHVIAGSLFGLGGLPFLETTLTVYGRIHLGAAIGFVSTLGYSGTQEIKDCLMALNQARASKHVNDEAAANTFTAQAWKRCAAGGVDLSFALLGGATLALANHRVALPMDRTTVETKILSENALNRALSPKEVQAIHEAHVEGQGEMGKDGIHPAERGHYTWPQILRKTRITRAGGMDPVENKILMEQGVLGRKPQPPVFWTQQFEAASSRNDLDAGAFILVRLLLENVRAFGSRGYKVHSGLKAMLHVLEHTEMRDLYKDIVPNSPKPNYEGAGNKLLNLWNLDPLVRTQTVFGESIPVVHRAAGVVQKTAADALWGMGGPFLYRFVHDMYTFFNFRVAHQALLHILHDSKFLEILNSKYQIQPTQFFEAAREYLTRNPATFEERYGDMMIGRLLHPLVICYLLYLFESHPLQNQMVQDFMNEPDYELEDFLVDLEKTIPISLVSKNISFIVDQTLISSQLGVFKSLNFFKEDPLESIVEIQKFKDRPNQFQGYKVSNFVQLNEALRLSKEADIIFIDAHGDPGNFYINGQSLSDHFSAINVDDLKPDVTLIFLSCNFGDKDDANTPYLEEPWVILSKEILKNSPKGKAVAFINRVRNYITVGEDGEKLEKSISKDDKEARMFLIRMFLAGKATFNQAMAKPHIGLAIDLWEAITNVYGLKKAFRVYSQEDNTVRLIESK